jgi:transcriptional regulator
MYLREVHADAHVPTLRQFIRANSLGIFLTTIPSESYPLIQLTHIPWVLDVEDNASETDLGILRGHMARANPQSKNIIDTLKALDSTHLSQEVSILFNGPANHYITPKWYVETKPATAKVVPTWDYSAVQVYGTATVYYDSKAPETSEFLGKQIRDLTNQSEREVMGYTGEGSMPEPWAVEDAPERYVNLLKGAIIGVEVKITRLEGKFKMSQELDQGDRQGVINGLNEMQSEVPREVARTVEARSPCGR